MDVLLAAFVGYKPKPRPVTAAAARTAPADLMAMFPGGVIRL